MQERMRIASWASPWLIFNEGINKERLRPQIVKRIPEIVALPQMVMKAMKNALTTYWKRADKQPQDIQY